MKEFASEIYAAVRSGRVAQPFNSVMVKQVLSWLGRWNVQNMPLETGTTELFIRVRRGFYRLKKATNQISADWIRSFVHWKGACVRDVYEVLRQKELEVSR
jgi:hypothetical protein